MPRGPDLYTPRNPPTYPFATLFHAAPDQCIPQLLSCLPAMEELFEYLAALEKKVNVCALPHVPVEISRSEVERFLFDPKKNVMMCPDMLALLFSALALGAQHSVFDKGGGKWDAHVMEAETRKGNVYIAAAMQALRLASFMHKPSLLGIQALIMIAPYLTNTGRFLEAWTLFGTTIRLAQGIGLHRHPRYLDPAPPSQRECRIRQKIWWHMLHIDEQYSLTLGRPLGISGIGDCPWPRELTTDATMLRFGEFANHFTVLARQILSSDRLTNIRIDDFTDAFRGLLDTMPETLQFDESWSRRETSIPDWPLSAMAAVYFCKTHTYLILLNRQRIEKRPVLPNIPTTKTTLPSFRPVNRTPSTHSSPTTSAKASLRGRALVLASSEALLSAFLFCHDREPGALIDWTMGQQALNSCMLLLLDALESRKGTPGVMKVEQALAVFRELADNNVHQLAGLAVERISWCLQELRNMVQQPQGMDAPTRALVQAEAAQIGETTRVPRTVETVMGNTGMQLLEDLGLQAFAHEAFAPIAYGIPGGRIPMEATRY
ncbi:hypothetical protein EJ02DRAFT_452044 [Clathrospora elynae]|uniref:Xylanolytic transcriptional activator regulatory domain-containing protein n=1 Tax=Clathrospora elynae TaxID=706981 RepID=A0A6A5SW96_9PLEO|nr:hypothetical protein EJ02DRAFT_452044 [Clathrospora elynae]